MFQTDLTDTASQTATSLLERESNDRPLVFDALCWIGRLRHDPLGWQQWACVSSSGYPIHDARPTVARVPKLDTSRSASATLTVNDLCILMPYENSLLVMSMNGPQVKEVLERGYRNYRWYK